MDDLQVATAIMKGCGFYLRPGLLDVPMKVLADLRGRGRQAADLRQ